MHVRDHLPSQARDNTLAANLDIQPVSVSSMLPRDQVGEHRLPPVTVGNTLNASIPPQTPSGIRRLGQSQGRDLNTVNGDHLLNMDKMVTMARGLNRDNIGPDSRRHSMIISGCSGRDPKNTSKSSGLVPPCPRSQSENQGQSQSISHEVIQSSSIRNMLSSFQSRMSHVAEWS